MNRAVKGLLGLSLFYSLQTWALTSTPTSLKSTPELHKKINLRAELTGIDYFKMTEDNLYVEVLTHYQNNKSAQLNQTGQIFLKRFPTSVHADNVLYLLGYNALERKKYSEALRHFDVLVKKYPASNKAVSAEFAKGIAYKNMKLKNLARSTFFKLRKKYPGSPEFYRAENELKILIMK